ncbi:MAG TPA: PASTA domain-containing protein [Candidatus Hydrogenedentes bacterium]|nr:PASTA domain-containing protein [Candidatus Hydrogenedentota bacterium]
MRIIYRSLVFVMYITYFAGAFSLSAAPVTFNDTALLNAVKTQWEAATGLILSDPPEDSELANASFTMLDAHGLAIADLTGLEACISLTDLNLGMNQISDLTPISGLTSLVWLDLGFGQDIFTKGGGIDPFQTGTNLIADITPLAGLVNLQYLSLMGNDGITGIAAVNTMDSLNQLWLSMNPITDFSPLNGVADTLTLFGDISCGMANADIPVLNGMTNLGILFLFAENGISDISGLSALNLNTLILVACPITDINVASNWTNLETMIGNQTQITNLNALSGLANLQQVETSECLLNDISGIAGLSNLKIVRLDSNQISDISALQNLPAVEEISLNNNLITDIQTLVDNPGLGGNDYCSLNNNPLSEDARCSQLPALRAKFNSSENVVCDATCGPTYTLTLSVNGTGDVHPEAGVHAYEQDTWVILNAIPISGSGQAFSGWTGDEVSTYPSLSVFMDSDKSITANFVPGDWTLTISKTGDPDGSTWFEPGIYSYLDGQYASVSENANGNAYFNGWSGAATGYSPSVSILMDANKTVTASFTSTGYQLTFTIQGQGNIKDFYNNGPFYYASGANFSLEAQPYSYLYVFDHWEGDIGMGADPYDPILPITMDQNRAVTAVFVEDSRTLTIIIDGPGSTDPAGSPSPGTQHIYPKGLGVCVQALLGANVAFDHWSGDIEGTPPSTPNLCVTMDQDRTVTAHFLAADWSLTLQKTGNGNINPAPGAYGYIDGAQANFNIQLISGGDAFDQWTGDINSGTETDTWNSVLMDRNRTVTANFMPGDWTLTLTTSGAAGNMYPSPGTYAYLDGRTANLSAFTSSTSFFAGWTGDNESDTPNIAIVMDSNKSVTANFAGSGYVLNVSAQGDGWTSLNGMYYFASSAEPVLTASPFYGWRFSEWIGDLPTGSDPADPELPVLMDMDRSITAVFLLDTKTLTMIIEGQGTTSPAGAPSPGIDYEYADGTQVMISAERGMEGWAFSYWSGDIGFETSSSPVITVIMNQDRTVVANYIPADWTLTLNYTGNGSTWPAPGAYGYVDGSSVEAVANIMAGGDAFDHWEGTLAGMDIYDPGQRFTIYGDVTLTAVFTPGDYTLETTVTGGGTAEYLSHPAGVYQYLAGRNANLEVRPWPETFWGGYSGDVNTWDYTYKLLMDGNKNVTITLGTSGYELVVNQIGGGRTNPSGTRHFVAGANPTVHAIDQGSILFDHWSGDLPAGTDPYDRNPVILMNQDRTITASFLEANWYLYLQVIGNGVTDPAPGLYWFLDGAPFSVTASAGADSFFLHWQGDLPVGQDPNSITVSGTMTQSREIIAVFAPATVTVPDLSGKTQEQAAAVLAALGLVLGTVTEEYSSAVSAGQILTQDPPASTIVPYGSVVSIVVSLGPCYANVPNLAGLSQAEAEAALTAANLTLGTVAEESSDIIPEGQIISQQPVYGLIVACGAAVNIVVSSGVAEEGEGEGSVTGPHTADQDNNFLISLSELLRIIQFFNSNGLHCEAGTEDGYAPGPGDTSCASHDSDYNPQDWLINLSELLRVIQFFNSGGYHPCEGSEDSFCPGQ